MTSIAAGRGERGTGLLDNRGVQAFLGLALAAAIFGLYQYLTMDGVPQGPGPAPEPIPGTPPPAQPIPGSGGYKSPGGNPPIPVDFPGRPGPYGPH